MVQTDDAMFNDNANTNDDSNKNMLLDLDNLPDKTQGKDTNQQNLLSDTPILQTVGNKRVLSASESSNDKENPAQDLDDN